MKKILGIMLAVIFLFLVGCGFGGVSEPMVQESVKEESEIPKKDLSEVAGPKTLEFIKEYNEENGYTMDCTAGPEGAKINLYSAVKGTNSYVSVYNDTESYIIIARGENMYMLMPSSKTAYVSQVSLDDNVNYMREVEQMAEESLEYREGDITIEGVPYVYEAYVNGNEEVKYCFKGDTLKYLIIDTPDEYLAIKVNNLSKDVDESLFEIPADYRIR